MTERNLALIIYFIADLLGDGWVDNGDMVNCIRRMNGEAEITGNDLTQETDRFSRGVQNQLKRPGSRLIEDDGINTGGRGTFENRGRWRITDAGRAEAQALLDQIIIADMQE